MTLRRHSQLDLTVKGETVERIYSWYKAERLVVNRRYQRKLVWTLEEKTDFIDSIVSNFPVPIILLADQRLKGQDQVEIIDGMQRLNAVISYIENEFSLEGNYFDLNSLAVTKKLLDDGDLDQREPKLDRETCVQIASYLLPLSIFEAAEREHIEEVFRRINSGGRKLSRQELRIAGATGSFAESVRKLSSLFRGDASATDHVLLNDMKKISITSKDLNYGIDVDTLFWVRNGVLTKDQVRESRDEEIIADMISYMISESPPPSRSEYLDAIFGFRNSGNSQEAHKDIELRISKYGPSVLMSHFQRVYDELRLSLEEKNKSLGEILFKRKPARAPRYFQVVFLSLFDQLVRTNRVISNRSKLIDLLNGAGDKINVPEGGSWGAQDRATEIKRTSATIEEAFENAQHADPARAMWINQFETLLTQSLTEQSAYEFKQGFLKLDGKSKFDEDNFEKILQTIVGISNIGKNHKGYIIVGVADEVKDANRIKELYGVSPTPFRNFYITGIEHEAKASGVSIDQYFQTIVSKIEKNLSGSLRLYVASRVKLVNYYDKSVLVIEIEGQDDPNNIGGKFFLRHGNSLREIQTTELVEFITNYKKLPK